jgi:replicative DNA helicase
MSESSEKVKIAPNSKESEMIVLGSMLTSINSLNIGADGLDESDFYFTEHRIIFQTLKNAYRNDKPADVHLIGEELKRQDKLKAIGGLGYLTTLAQYAGTSAYIEEYIELVRDKSILRRMINAAQEVERGALNNPEDVHVLLDDAQAKFFIIGQAANTNAGVLIKELLSGVKAHSQLPYLKELQERQEHFQKKGPNDLGITGIPTHFVDLDKLINGFGTSNLMILAARPAMGKTALALNIAENIAFRNSLPVGIFSLEMTAEQLLHRMICSQSEVESDKIRTGSINGIEYQRVVAAVGAMMKGTVVIDDQPGLKITDLRARARRMKESHDIQLLIVDYLQLLSGSGLSRNVENRQNEISEISRMMKTLARELNLPILCLSQLSRKVEERQGHRPMMSDLRESGCLTGDTQIQDAETGTFYTIKELAERQEQTPIYIHAVDKDLKMGKHRMTKAFYSGKKTVFELRTRSGRTIKASANHPFLQLEGWIPLEKLKKGDRIGLPRHLKVENPKDKLTNTTLFARSDLRRFEPACWPNFESTWVYSSSSSALINQTQHLLTRVGISSTICIVPSKKGYRDMYHLNIFGTTNQQKFLDTVGCAGKRGHLIPQLSLLLQQISPNPNNDIIPKEAWTTFVRKAKEEFQLGWREVCAGVNTSYCGSSLFKSGISRQRMKSLYNVLPSKELLALAESDIYWDEIASIEQLGTEDVYDATVENVHNFVANDIIVHNSIEQDSDIVMFLLRREYYDPYDKPGLAELIVAKNRHGAVGSVNLTYRKELAQFANYSPMHASSSSSSADNDEAFAAFSP